MAYLNLCRGTHLHLFSYTLAEMQRRRTERNWLSVQFLGHAGHFSLPSERQGQPISRSSSPLLSALDFSDAGRLKILSSLIGYFSLSSLFIPPSPSTPVFYSLRALTPSPSLSDDTNEISRNKKKKKKKAKRKENFNGKRATEILARKVMPVAMATGVSC